MLPLSSPTCVLPGASVIEYLCGEDALQLGTLLSSQFRLFVDCRIGLCEEHCVGSRVESETQVTQGLTVLWSLMTEP